MSAGFSTPVSRCGGPPGHKGNGFPAGLCPVAHDGSAPAGAGYRSGNGVRSRRRRVSGAHPFSSAVRARRGGKNTPRLH